MEFFKIGKIYQKYLIVDIFKCLKNDKGRKYLWNANKKSRDLIIKNKKLIPYE